MNKEIEYILEGPGTSGIRNRLALAIFFAIVNQPFFEGMALVAMKRAFEVADLAIDEAENPAGRISAKKSHLCPECQHKKEVQS